jgi:hypothetical protein
MVVRVEEQAQDEVLLQRGSAPSPLSMRIPTAREISSMQRYKSMRIKSAV